MLILNNSIFSASGQLLNSRIQIEQLRHDQVDGTFPVLKITLP
jgi:hypothetical protein